MSIPQLDSDTDARLRSPDLGLPPVLSARLDARPDLARALATAMRLCWSTERWARAQGEELCRALATTDRDARVILLAPLAPLDGRGAAETRVVLTDGPWLPLDVLVRLVRKLGRSSSGEMRGSAPPSAASTPLWGPSVTTVRVADTNAGTIPPLPPSVRALALEDTAHLEVSADDVRSDLEELTVTSAPRAEPWDVLAIAGHRGWVRTISWHRGGARFATSGPDGAVRVWRAFDDSLGEVDPPAVNRASDDSASASRGAGLALLEGHTRPVLALAWAPRGSILASAGADGTVRIAEESAERWHERAVLDHAAGDAGIARAPTLGLAPPGAGEKGEVADLAWSPDGRRLATACDDGEVRVWTATRNGWRATILRGAKGVGHDGPVRRVAWAPDGLRLASAGADGRVRLWIDDGSRFVDGGVLASFTDWVRALDWSVDGTMLAAGSDEGTALLLQFAAARGRRRTISRKVEARIELAGHEGWVRRVAFDRDGKRLLTAGDDGVLRVFEIEAPFDGGECAPTAAIDHAVRITAARWSPSGAWIATGDDAGVLRVVRADDASLLVEGHGCEGTIGALAWHPDGGEIVTGSDDRLVRVWRPSRSGLGPVWGRILARGRVE